jgi:hypothetical protein
MRPFNKGVEKMGDISTDQRNPRRCCDICSCASNVEREDSKSGDAGRGQHYRGDDSTTDSDTGSGYDDDSDSDYDSDYEYDSDAVDDVTVYGLAPESSDDDNYRSNRSSSE